MVLTHRNGKIVRRYTNKQVLKIRRLIWRRTVDEIVEILAETHNVRYGQIGPDSIIVFEPKGGE